MTRSGAITSRPLFLENDVLQFINHGEGRIIPAKTKEETNEYQYHLKDHLGNVRLTFTTKDETETAIATLESNHVDEDRAKFLYYDEAIKVKNAWFDHTNNLSEPANSDGTGFGTVEGTATRLTATDFNGDGTVDDRYGLARSLSGDARSIARSMEVWAKYVDLFNANPGDAISQLIQYLGSAAAATSGVVVDGGKLGSMGGHHAVPCNTAWFGKW